MGEGREGRVVKGEETIILKSDPSWNLILILLKELSFWFRRNLFFIECIFKNNLTNQTWENYKI